MFNDFSRFLKRIRKSDKEPASIENIIEEEEFEFNKRLNVLAAKYIADDDKHLLANLIMNVQSRIPQETGHLGHANAGISVVAAAALIELKWDHIHYSQVIDSYFSNFMQNLEERR